MRWLISVFLVCLAPYSPANAADKEDTPLQLKVRPVLCITDERTPSCQMSFIIVWQSGQTGYYCLYSDYEEPPLHCWKDERQGELNDEHTVQASFRYWMTGKDAETLLAEVAIEVLRMDTVDRRRNRRNRHVWNIL